MVNKKILLCALSILPIANIRANSEDFWVGFGIVAGAAIGCVTAKKTYDWYNSDERLIANAESALASAHAQFDYLTIYGYNNHVYQNHGVLLVGEPHIHALVAAIKKHHGSGPSLLHQLQNHISDLMWYEKELRHRDPHNPVLYSLQTAVSDYLSHLYSVQRQLQTVLPLLEIYPVVEQLGGFWAAYVMVGGTDVWQTPDSLLRAYVMQRPAKQRCHYPYLEVVDVLTSLIGRFDNKYTHGLHEYPYIQQALHVRSQLEGLKFRILGMYEYRQDQERKSVDEQREIARKQREHLQQEQIDAQQRMARAAERQARAAERQAEIAEEKVGRRPSPQVHADVQFRT